MLTINIPNPCSQNFDKMPNAGDGRYCSECKNIVYDFSQMDDDELLYFVKQKSSVPCGRFHTSQLNRNIIPLPKHKNVFYRFNKIAAAMFTLLSFRSIHSKAESKQKHQIIFDSNYRNKSFSDSNSVTITGVVKDENGNPLEKAEIKLDNNLITVTDIDGKFSFELANENLINHKLYFSYPKLMPAVRTYYTAMMSTSYDVKLISHGTVRVSYITGVPALPPSLGDLPSLKFKTSSSQLSAVSKVILSTIASKMKSIPETNISINGYPKADYKSQTMCMNRVEIIRKYLVEKEGINQKRISVNCEVNGGDSNVVDIKQEFN